MTHQQGFTLVELMIVVGIVAILSAIGLPAYQNYLQRAALTTCCKRWCPTKRPLSYALWSEAALRSARRAKKGYRRQKARVTFRRSAS